MNAMLDGHVPSVAEVAVRAQVSRATAYRYFPTRSKLVTAIVHHTLQPIRSWRAEHQDGKSRVLEMFETNFPLMQAFEPQLRAAAQLSLEHWAQERAGLLEEEPYRRGHRKKILAYAVQPLKAKLAPRTVDRLQKALSIIFGIEPSVILKDIWGADDKEVIQVVRWMAEALTQAALAEHAKGIAKPAIRSKPKRHRS